MTGQYPVYPEKALSEEALSRRAKAHARFIEVFGDDDCRPSWFLKPEEKLGTGSTGPLTPAQLAAESEEGLQRVLELLDAFSKLVQPVWKTEIPGQKRSGRR